MTGIVAGAVLLALTVGAHEQPPTQRPDYPDDPFDSEYVVPAVEDIGVAAGQLRIFGQLGVAQGNQHSSNQNGEEMWVRIRGSVELLTFAHLGVRLTSGFEVPTGTMPLLWSVRAGPALHLLPYHRLDLGVFLEGGFAVVSPFSGTATPTVVPGITVDLAISARWFLHAEGALTWLRFPQGGQFVDSWSVGGSVGIGLAL